MTAGTSDMPVAEEAAVTLDALGDCVDPRHRRRGRRDSSRCSRGATSSRTRGVVIVVAGMEGALPSVVGGLVAAPVIAVPTSVGYGASFHGLARAARRCSTAARRA